GRWRRGAGRCDLPPGRRSGASRRPQRRRPAARAGVRPRGPDPAVRGRVPPPAVRVALLSRAAHPLHEPGGLERAVYHLARHLQAHGVETVLLTRPPTRAGSFPGEVVTVPYGGRASAHGRVLDRTLRYPRFAEGLGEKAAALVREGRVDL